MNVAILRARQGSDRIVRNTRRGSVTNMERISKNVERQYEWCDPNSGSIEEASSVRRDVNGEIGNGPLPNNGRRSGTNSDGGSAPASKRKERQESFELWQQLKAENRVTLQLSNSNDNIVVELNLKPDNYDGIVSFNDIILLMSILINSK